MPYAPIEAITPQYSQTLQNIQGSQQQFQSSVLALVPGPAESSLTPEGRAGTNLLNRAGELNQVEDNIGQSQSTIDAASNGLNAIGDLVRLGQAILDPSFSANNADFRTQYNEVLNQINSLAQDSGYRGTNLVAGTNGLNTSFNPERTSQLQTESGLPNNTLGLDRITDFTDASISQATASINEADSIISSVSTRFGSDQAILGIREEFTQNISNTFAEGADRLLNVDQAEEAVNLLTASAQVGFGQEVLAGEAERNSNILRLF